MEELIKAVETLSQNTIFDYLIVIVPILLSIVAIVISIYTIHKQNKIALFEMRYKALTQLKAILMYEEAIYELDDPTDIVDAFDMAFSTDLKIRGEDFFVKIGMITKQIYFDIGIIDPMLKKNSIDSSNLTESLASTILDASWQKIDSEERRNFHTLCQKLEPVYKKLSKKIYP